MFKLESVSYSYQDGIHALREVVLHVKRGEAVALMGANGCGKTTLLRMLNGLVFPQSGRYYFDGDQINRKSLHDIQFSKEFHRRVGYVFQNADAQLFCGSVEDEIAFGPRQLQESEEFCRERVDDCLKLLQIEHLRRRAPYALSGGEKRKTAFACVLALNPDALTADEPLAGLDPASQQKILELLQSLRAAGKTLIFATHNEALAKEVADTRVTMEQGRIVDVSPIR
ncbi:MAG: ABC transporter ATP-binding protein [Planctomycetia bacterium]|nr:ABC transporter ATP-binding protein [Planctomycetia bacterium]